MKPGLVMCVLLTNAVIVQSAHQSVRTMRQIGSAMKLKINAVFVRKGTYACTVVCVYIYIYFILLNGYAEHGCRGVIYDDVKKS